MFGEKLKSLFFGKAKSAPTNPSVATNYNPTVSATGLIYGMGTGSYDNNFASIARIAEKFAEVIPFAIDENGEPLKETPQLLRALQNPNEQMSGQEFAEALITMMLVHPIVYVLGWRKEGGSIQPGGKITPENIAGFTFLEGASAVKLENKTYYRTSDGKIYQPHEVLRFSLNINPYALMTGYSPSVAAKKWATVDDYVADYQAGFFRNGAVPAGQMVVTAPSVKDFNDTVDKLQQNHRGAINANNIVYVHRPVSSIDGKPMSAQVEWIPFETKTNNSTLQSLFDQANKKIDMDFGVPQEIKGYLSNSNYASVETADYIFDRYVLYPKLVKVWGKFTHEMNRITGGLGFALSFDYETPVLTDALASQVNSFTNLLNQGFSVESSAKALNLPSAFLSLEKSEPAPSNNLAVDDGAEDTSTPDQEAKAIKKKALEIQENDKEEVDPALVAIIAAYMTGIISEAQRRYIMGGVDEPLTEEALKKWLIDSGYAERNVDLVVAILSSVMARGGTEAVETFAEQLGLSEQTFELSEEAIDGLRKRTSELLAQFGYDTISAIQAVIDRAHYDNWFEDEAQMIAELQNLNTTNAYRVDRWANTEYHIAVEAGVLLGAISVGETAGMRTVKTWRINPNSPHICPNCLAMNGQTVPADKPFSNGNMEAWWHPNCHCYAEVHYIPAGKSVESAKPKTVKVECPHCKRYMCESDGGSIKGIICANSKCKKKYNIEVKNGEIFAEEIEK